MKPWSWLLLFLVSLEAASSELLPYDDSEPDTELSVRETVDGPVTASILVGPERQDADLFEPSKIYLKVGGSDGVWWVHTPDAYDAMDIVQFINTSHLLVTLSTPVSTSTGVLDLVDRSLNLIGSGAGEVIPGDPDDTLIYLSGQRGFAGEVFLYSSITDLQGRVIEFISSGEEDCLPISEIMSDGADLSRLQQSLDYCVGIAR
jgi:hypothetical protein